MIKCENCQSSDLVIIGGAMLIGTELFCDIIQCASCFLLFASITRQFAIKLVDERDEDEPVYDEPFSVCWDVTEERLKLAEERSND